MKMECIFRKKCFLKTSTSSTLLDTSVSKAFLSSAVFYFVLFFVAALDVTQLALALVKFSAVLLA